MSGNQEMPLKALLAAIGWTNNRLARYLDVSAPSVHRWATGQTRTPLQVTLWLRSLAAAHLANPPPVRAEGKRRGRPSLDGRGWARGKG